MSICKQCDRCGKSYSNYNYEKGNEKNFNGLAFVSINDSATRYNNYGVKDLCKDCIDSFKTWWDQNKIIFTEEPIFKFNNFEDHEEDESEEIKVEVNTDSNEVLDVNTNAEGCKVNIQEPESDGEKYGEHKMG